MAPERCETLGAQRLHAPGQLAVTIEGATVGTEYTLQVEEQLPASGDATPSAVIDQVLQRLGGIATSATSAIGGPQGGGADQQQQAVQDQIDQVVHLVGGALGNAIHGRIDAVFGPRPPAIRPTAIAQVDDGDTAAAALARHASFDSPNPSIMWVVTLEDSDVLELRAAGATDANIIDGVLGQCADFGTVNGTAIATYVSTGSSPSVAQVGRALALNQDQLQSVLSGDGPIGIDARIRDLLNEARGATPSADAQAIQRLFVESRLHALVTHCRANLTYVRNHLTLDAAQTTAAASLDSSLTSLSDHTQSASDNYARVIAPTVTAIASQYLRQTATQSTIELGSLSLHAGHLSLTLSRREGQAGASAQRLLDTELEVANDVWLAVSVGIMGTACDRCLTSVDEVDRPAVGTTPSHRAIATTANSYSFNSAIAIHVSPLIVGEHHLGFMLGYPLTPTAGTSESVLAGLTWGYAPAGLYVSAGMHLFIRRVIRDGVTEVDLSAAGNENLRVSDLATDQPAIAGFLMLSLSSDLVFSLARL